MHAAGRGVTAILLGALLVPAAASGGETPDYSATVVNPKFVHGTFEPRSRTFLVCGTDGTIMRSTNGRTWLHADTPTSNDLARVAAGETGDVLIAVGLKGTVIRSDDRGRTWNLAATPRTDSDLRAVVHHVSTGAWIAAGSNGAILRSLDGGKRWQPVDTAHDQTFEALFVEPRGAVLIGGTDGVVGHSPDGGASWSFTSIDMAPPLTPITGFHLFGERLIATSALGRLLLSDDGRHWKLLDIDGKTYFTDGAFDPHHDSFVLTGHTGDVFRSQDAGDSWQRIEIAPGAVKNVLSAVRFDARSRSLVTAGHHGTVARSTDGGRSWRTIPSSSNATIESLVHDAERGVLVGFGAGGFLQESRDFGQSWQSISPELDVYLRELAILRDGTLIATGELGSILRSTDRGGSWKVVPITYPNMNTPPNLRALVVVPANDTLLAAGPPGTIIRSQDGGRHWQVTHWTPLEAEEAFPWMLLEPGDRAAVIEARGGMYFSRDSGRSWQRSKLSTDRELWHGTVLERERVMLAAGQRGVAARSTDAGATWAAVDTQTEHDLFGSFADESSGGLFLMGRNGTLLRSTDSGKTWRNIQSGTTLTLRRMFRDPRHAGELRRTGCHRAFRRPRRKLARGEQRHGWRVARRTRRAPEWQPDHHRPTRRDPALSGCRPDVAPAPESHSTTLQECSVRRTQRRSGRRGGTHRETHFALIAICSRCSSRSNSVDS
jgi:photosystem II stability/assembly factor-like uncharacterized protein